jgi:ribosomal protein S21
MQSGNQILKLSHQRTLLVRRAKRRSPFPTMKTKTKMGKDARGRRQARAGQRPGTGRPRPPTPFARDLSNLTPLGLPDIP